MMRKRTNSTRKSRPTLVVEPLVSVLMSVASLDPLLIFSRERKTRRPRKEERIRRIQSRDKVKRKEG